MRPLLDVSVLALLLISVGACAVRASEPSTVAASSTPRPFRTGSVGASVTARAIEDSMTRAALTGQSRPSHTPTSTRTPTTTPVSPSSSCPPSDPTLSPNFPSLTSEGATYPNDGLVASILAFLNGGGSPSSLVGYEWASDPIEVNKRVRNVDVTGDAAPELLMSMDGARLVIFACTQNRYSVLLDHRSQTGELWAPSIERVSDLNDNGMPDLLLEADGRGFNDIDVLEWRNGSFHDLLLLDSSLSTLPDPLHEGVDLPGPFAVVDFEPDGVSEIVLEYPPPLGDIAYYLGSYPLRAKTVIVKWDGQAFVPSSVEFDPPIYRFQAAFDADWSFLSEDYEMASRYYERVISDDTLLPWSDAMYSYILDWSELMYTNLPTPTAPAPDPRERVNLAAYARYRLVLIAVTLGDNAEAEDVIQAMRTLYADGQEGHPFVELAEVFWERTQASSDAHSACIDTVAFFEENRRDLATFLPGPLEGGAHGEYEAGIACPF